MTTEIQTADPTVVKSKRRRVSAAHLKAAREHVGLSQEELARRLDVRTPTISERENAANGVNWETWIAWAYALELPIDWAPSP